MIRSLGVVALLIGALCTQALAADFEAGVEAYERRDYPAALREFRPLAEQGHAGAQAQMGLMYFWGFGVSQDDVEAVKWYRKAAEQGIVSAQSSLGFMYSSGRGVPEDDVEAVKWLRKAAEQGNASAQSNLGTQYSSGRGVPEDDVEAYAWFNIAAAQGHEWAEYNKENVAESMTHEQRVRAQQLSREYWKKYVLPFRD